VQKSTLPGGKTLAGQGLLAVGAGEALPVPGVIPVGHSPLGDHLDTTEVIPIGHAALGDHLEISEIITHHGSSSRSNRR
jgi:hypothetical protein